jgi:hypothetical protein
VFKRFVVAFSAITIAAACGSAPARGGSAGPPPTTASPVVRSVPPGTTTTTAGASLTVTASDNGHVYAVKTGQVVSVSLSSGELWTAPMPSDPTVLHLIDGTVSTTTGDATATFSATTTGSSIIKSSRRCLPVPGRLCALYIALWSVTITVS